MNKRDIEYALSKQVPDMARGFTIHTNYGDIVVEGGRVASVIAITLELLLTQQHAEDIELGRMDTYGFDTDASAIGRDFVHSPAQLSVPDAQTISDVLVAQHAEVAKRLQSLHVQIASLRQAVTAPLSEGLPLRCQAAPDPAQPGGAPVAHTHCAAPSVPCAGLAPLQPGDPAPAKTLHDLSWNSPGVEE